MVRRRPRRSRIPLLHRTQPPHPRLRRDHAGAEAGSRGRRPRHHRGGSTSAHGGPWFHQRRSVGQQVARAGSIRDVGRDPRRTRPPGVGRGRPLPPALCTRRRLREHRPDRRGPRGACRLRRRGEEHPRGRLVAGQSAGDRDHAAGQTGPRRGNRVQGRQSGSRARTAGGSRGDRGATGLRRARPG